MSGTRGYLVICLALSAYYFLKYGNKTLKFLLVGVGIIVFALQYESIIGNFLDVTRLGSSTGRRTSENLFVWYYMSSNSFINFLFGFGFGKNVGTLSNIDGLLSMVSDSEYTYYILHKVNGFHNFFATIYYSSGFVGVCLIYCIFFKILYDLCKKIKDKKMIVISCFYILLYIFMLWYRWSATSGILEFSCLAFLISNNKKSNKENRSTIMSIKGELYEKQICQ